MEVFPNSPDAPLVGLKPLPLCLLLQLTDLLSCTCPSSTYSTTEAVMFYCCDTSKAFP